MKKKETTDIVFLLDRSGSMHGMESDTIGGYNSYLKGIKDTNAKITTVLFDHGYEMLTKREDITKVKELNKESYYTRGTTALLDAIGKTITYMDKQNPSKVVFIITTDGLENDSVKYNKAQIKEMIEGHSNWEFIYLGANIDSYGEAGSIGIRRDRISNYSKSKNGMSKMFNNLKDVCLEYACDGTIRNDWKDGLEEYIDENKKQD